MVTVLVLFAAIVTPTALAEGAAALYRRRREEKTWRSLKEIYYQRQW